ncbi:UDP-N-acetylglucosamine transporter TMEM241 [Microcaecilia unicolor]|uniref:Transmembrane protein 241 n=1 Tax=Microcaecilia unicolor TaxID=1415580 RepID=A0A6P7X160_9AMPH|nr:transmembrane protein 241 [Microcaecilia unicolor]
MYLKRLAVGLVFCLFHLAAYFTNKYVLSVLKFTYPTLFQGWQTLLGGLLLHISWKLGLVEISSSSRSQVLSWVPASVLFVGNIYAGSRALSKLPIPVFFTLQNAAEVVSCGLQRFIQKEHVSLMKICSSLFLLIAASCLPLHDPQFDPDGYFWAVVHLSCVGGYKVFQKSQKSTVIRDLDQQYINYIFSVVLLSVSSHPTGDLFSVTEFPFLYFYRFHSGCCASFNQIGYVGLQVIFGYCGMEPESCSTDCIERLKLKGMLQKFRKLMLLLDKMMLHHKLEAVESFIDFIKFSVNAASLTVFWIFLDAVHGELKSSVSSSILLHGPLFGKVITAGVSLFFFDMILNVPTVCCILLGGLGESLLVYTENAST